jgi:putative NADH-flavin reductase
MLARLRLLAGCTSAKLAMLAGALLLAGCVSRPPQTAPTPPAWGSAADKNITIALLGATGMAGGFILEQALAEGYRVRALARTPQKLAPFKDRVTIIQGDARDLSTIETLLQGSNVVVSALGPVKADGAAAKMVNTTVTGLVLQAMPKYDIKRYIVVSGAAVVMPGDDRNFTGWLMRQLAALTLHDALEDKQAEYELLAASSADWTLVRCPLIEAGPFVRSPRASLVTPTAFTLRAGDLAQFVIDQIDSTEFIGKGPFLNSQ